MGWTKISKDTWVNSDGESVTKISKGTWASSTGKSWTKTSSNTWFESPQGESSFNPFIIDEDDD